MIDFNKLQEEITKKILDKVEQMSEEEREAFVEKLQEKEKSEKVTQG